jgi:hypothetical protein
MRTLLSLLCVLWASPAERLGGERDPSDRRAEYRTLLAEISAGRAASAVAPPRDLPEDLREAVEAWTAGVR